MRRRDIAINASTPLITRRRVLTSAAAFAGHTLVCSRPSFAATKQSSRIDVSGRNALRTHAAAKHLFFGAAVNPKALREDEDYARLLRQQCSMLVAENCMKWKAIEPQQGQFQFDDADFILAFAEKYKLKMRGHTLIWHDALPAWVEAGMTSSNARQWMIAHIQNICERYNGRIHSWDVVNEAIRPEDGRPDGLRNNIWLRTMGPEYIETAFRTARAADPAALLTYNDWGLEDESPQNEERRRIVLTMMRRLRQRNVPIDAIGIQAHLNLPNPAGYGAGLQRFLASLKELDLQVFITELDADDHRLPDNMELRDAEVAKAFGQFLDIVLPGPAVTAVLTWGLTSRYTWLRDRDHNSTPRGLPFDDNLEPTAGFNAIRDAFDRRRIQPAVPKPITLLRPGQSWR